MKIVDIETPKQFKPFAIHIETPTEAMALLGATGCVTPNRISEYAKEKNGRTGLNAEPDECRSANAELYEKLARRFYAHDYK